MSSKAAAPIYGEFFTTETDERSKSEMARSAAAECTAFVNDFIEDIVGRQFREWHRINQPSIAGATERPRRRQTVLFTGTYEYALPSSKEKNATGKIDESFKIAYLAWRVSQPSFTTAVIRKLRGWEGMQPDPDEWLPGLFRWCIKDMRQRERPGFRTNDEQLLPNDYAVITCIPHKGARTVRIHTPGFGRWPGLLLLCDDKGTQELHSSFPDAELPRCFSSIDDLKRLQEAEFEELESEAKTPKKRKTSGGAND